MTRDIITRLGSSDVQHGSFNDRVYLMNLAPEDTDRIIPAMEEMAKKYHYSKLFARVPDSAKDRFCAAGYQVEAHIPGMYRGAEDGWFLARYPEPARADPDEALPLTADLLRTAGLQSDGCENATTTPGFVIEETGSKDAGVLAKLYATVFETYPFPIHDPAWLRETMDDGDRYFVVRSGGRVVAASSAEVDASGKNAEMSDFATAPEYRGRGLCPALLKAMERAMRRSGIVTAYAIARAAFYPVNITFARAGYQFGGTLVNDTQICGALESMNVWYKPLAKERAPQRDC
jgi:putative beta-lysine N-acetyltransferase